MVAWLKLTLTLPSQSSLALTVAGAGTASQATVALAGTPLSTGPVVSLTVMVWVALVALPQPSVAVQVRLIV